ncbi:hypothetical protein AVEN_212234-1 [Araneus ventricosus]|uniref:Uncharacterized protein n=1 Tax=Araneus ventricosus TaxID=182803 RepID=A0A4Y2EJW0_ARAVE|nr:hypothetical protein AVEN_212234-1 [Araneus ventricosus]
MNEIRLLGKSLVGSLPALPSIRSPLPPLPSSNQDLPAVERSPAMQTDVWTCWEVSKAVSLQEMTERAVFVALLVCAVRYCFCPLLSSENARMLL